jgi:hypothetical protein
MWANLGMHRLTPCLKRPSKQLVGYACDVPMLWRPADPVGLMARAKPKARPDRRAANLLVHHKFWAQNLSSSNRSITAGTFF